MDFKFTQEQELLRASVRKFVEKDYDWETRKQLLHSEQGFSRTHWQSYADLGWTAIAFSEADGGLGGSAIDLIIVMEELAKGLVLEPYFSTVVLGGGLLSLVGTDAARKHIAGIIDGTLQVSVAFVEPTSRFDLHHVQTRAQQVGNELVVNGHKCFVLGGGSANVLLVAARTSGNANDRDGITLLAIDANHAGVSIERYRTVDGLAAADVTFSDVHVPLSAVLGDLGKGLLLLERAVDRAMVALGAEAVGVMEVLFKSTLAYGKERKQFGVTIGSFQVLQHRMTDMMIEYELSKSLMYMTAMKLDASSPDLPRAAAALKAQIGKSGRYVGQQAIQIHGGMGMTDELAVSHFFKRMTMIDLTFGNRDHHLTRLALM